MEFDDDGIDDDSVSPVLPPDDRLWRHPSEIDRSPAGRPGREPRLLTVVALTSSITALLTLGLVAAFGPVRTERVVVQNVATPDGGAVRGVNDVSGVAERIQPSVVTIEARSSGETKSGSGVVYRSDGMVLTSHHVVAGAAALTVLLGDGSARTAKVIGSDAETDIAVVDVDGDGYAVALMSSGDRVKVGQPAIAVGAPTAPHSAPTVTVGVVSALGRDVQDGQWQLLGMIQTDFVISPASYGGPVLDRRGAVIGIASRNVDSESGSFAYVTPIQIARTVADQLVASGRLHKVWLGIEGDDLGANEPEQNGADGGVVVTRVREASPADRASLRPDDVIVSVEGEPVRSMAELKVRLRTRQPGSVVTLRVLRSGEPVDIEVRLALKPDG